MAAIEIEFYSPKTLAQRWTCSRSHVYELLREGRLQGVPWGRLKRIPRAEVLRYEREVLAPVKKNGKSK